MHLFISAYKRRNISLIKDRTTETKKKNDQNKEEMMSMNALCRRLNSIVRTGYNDVVNRAKNNGDAETMHVAGAEYVKRVLMIEEAETTCGINLHDRSKYVSFPYVHEETVEKTLEDGNVISEVRTKTYSIVSVDRDNRCTLMLENGTTTQNITEVPA